MSVLAPQQYPRQAMSADVHRAQRLPRQIGKYRVIGRLGEGATSEVLLARDEFHFDPLRSPRQVFARR